MADSAYPRVARMGTVHHLPTRRPEFEPDQRPLFGDTRTPEQMLAETTAELAALGATEEEALRFLRRGLARMQVMARHELCAHPDREHDHVPCLETLWALRAMGLDVL